MERIISTMTADDMENWIVQRGGIVTRASEELGLSPRSIHYYLTGRQIPYTVAKLCWALSEIDTLRAALARGQTVQQPQRVQTPHATQTGRTGKDDLRSTQQNQEPRSQMLPRGTLVTV